MRRLLRLLLVIGWTAHACAAASLFGAETRKGPSPGQPKPISIDSGQNTSTTQIVNQETKNAPPILAPVPNQRSFDPVKTAPFPMEASSVLNYAALLVTVVAAIFTIFVAVFGALGWFRFEKFRKELTNQRKKLDREGRILQRRVDTFRAEIEVQQQMMTANKRFLEAVISNYSNLLVGIVEGFDTALPPDAARRLSSLIFEAEAALDLFHPDNDAVLKALWRLEVVGADSAVASLVRLRDDRSVDPEIRLRAQQVLTKVTDRLKRNRH